MPNTCALWWSLTLKNPRHTFSKTGKSIILKNCPCVDPDLYLRNPLTNDPWQEHFYRNFTTFMYQVFLADFSWGPNCFAASFWFFSCLFFGGCFLTSVASNRRSPHSSQWLDNKYDFYMKKTILYWGHWGVGELFISNCYGFGIFSLMSSGT